VSTAPLATLRAASSIGAGREGVQSRRSKEIECPMKARSPELGMVQRPQQSLSGHGGWPECARGPMKTPGLEPGQIDGWLCSTASRSARNYDHPSADSAFRELGPRTWPQAATRAWPSSSQCDGRAGHATESRRNGYQRSSGTIGGLAGRLEEENRSAGARTERAGRRPDAPMSQTDGGGWLLLGWFFWGGFGLGGLWCWGGGVRGGVWGVGGGVWGGVRGGLGGGGGGGRASVETYHVTAERL